MKKKEKTPEPDFNLEEALENTNRYLRGGFKEFIKDEKITNQKKFDKLYKKYEELN